jgi:hypothetical protein
MKDEQIKEEKLDEILHDYRDDIVANDDKCKGIRDKWDGYSSLQKAIEFKKLEIHVERYNFGKNNPYDLYWPNYKNEYATTDIMNGWWYCFKQLFGCKSKSNIEHYLKTDNTLMELFKLLKANKQEYSDDEKKEIIQSFLKYLAVVYTIGNMTPAPINPGGQFECWEYKLVKYGENYKEGYIVCLRFQDYINSKVWKSTDFKSDPKGYIDSRIDKIIRRGYRIVMKKETIEYTEAEEKHIVELKKCLQDRITSKF